MTPDTKYKNGEEFELTEDIIGMIDRFKEGEHHESQLIAVLHEIQLKFGYLPVNLMDDIAQRLQIPTAVVSGVASFYHYFRLVPKGKYDISICMGTACFVKGADKILEALRSELGIELGETTIDGLFSLSISRCLGICALAPIITVNDNVYSQVDPGNIPAIINNVKAQ